MRWFVRMTTLGLLVAAGCGSDRDAPRGGAGAGVGGAMAVATTGTGMAQASCDDAGVLCDQQIYFGDCEQFQSKRTLWTFLAYKTEIPADAYIEFRVRTANTEADLAGAPYRTAATAWTDNQHVPPSVPIHLDTVLSDEEILRTWLELELMRVPGPMGGTAIVDGWDLYFSCEDV